MMRADRQSIQNEQTFKLPDPQTIKNKKPIRRLRNNV
jgi:hypothetical protein